MPSKSHLRRLYGLALIAVSQAAAATDCQPPKHLSASDSEAIHLLAHGVGMKGPLRLCGVWWGAPSGCEAVLVESLPIVEGSKRSWQQLYLGRAAPDPDMQCPGGRKSGGTYRHGGWLAAKDNLSTTTTWRFTHGPARVDARLGQGVSYEVADTLIRALCEHVWRDELSHNGRVLMERTMRQSPDWVNHITSVSSSYGRTGTYEVGFSELGGLLLLVELEGTRVKLLRADIVVV